MKYIAQLDLFKQPIQLCLDNQYYHKTKIGTFFSIFLITILIILGFSQVEEMINRNNPTIVTSEVLPIIPKLQQLTFKTFMLNFGFENSTSYQQWKQDSIVKVELNQYIRSENKFNITQVPLKQCTPEDIGINELKPFMQTFNLSMMYCIDFGKVNQLDIQGQCNDPEYKFLELKLIQCQNTTDQNECAPQEEIDKYLNNANFIWNIADVYLDFNDFKNPIKIVATNKYASISNKRFKNVDFFFEPIEIIDDSGYITKDVSTLNTLKYNSQAEQIDFNEQGNMFFRIVFRVYDRNYICQRSYIKLQQILGNLGGLGNFLFILIALFISQINQLSQRIILFNQLFNFQVQKSDSVIQNRKQMIELQQNNNVNYPHEYLKLKQLMLYFKNNTHGIVLQFCDFMQIIFNCLYVSSENKSRIQQLIYAEDKVKQLLDVGNIIMKLNEIDKLKMIFLSPEQIKLFDVIDKPTIGKFPYDPDNNHDHNKYWSILKQKKTHFYQDALETLDAYDSITKEDSLINKMLFKILNIQLKNILESNKIVEPHQRHQRKQISSDDDYTRKIHAPHPQLSNSQDYDDQEIALEGMVSPQASKSMKLHIKFKQDNQSEYQ